MPRFHFSLTKLHRLQKQKKHLADIELMQTRANLDAAVARRKELEDRLEQLVSKLTRMKSANPEFIQSHHDLAKQLHIKIEESLQEVREAEGQWQNAVANSKRENTSLEGFELAYQSELSEFRVELERSDQAEQTDNILRTWQTEQGVSNND